GRGKQQRAIARARAAARPRLRPGRAETRTRAGACARSQAATEGAPLWPRDRAAAAASDRLGAAASAQQPAAGVGQAAPDTAVARRQRAAGYAVRPPPCGTRL